MDKKEYTISGTDIRKNIASNLSDLEKMTLEQLTIRGQEQYSKADLIKIGLIMYRNDLNTIKNLVETGLLLESVRRTKLDLPGNKFLMEKLYSVTDEGREFYNKEMKNNDK